MFFVGADIANAELEITYWDVQIVIDLDLVISCG